MGYKVVIPKEFIVEMAKKDASLLHFDEINKDDVDALLIVNETNKEQNNYIGANGFAELAFGFYKGRKIFLLNDIYEPIPQTKMKNKLMKLKNLLLLY